jgi:hypothetical protein
MYYYLLRSAMNDHYYYDIICEFIDKKDRAICSSRDRHIVPIKNKRWTLLMATLYVHLGTPCDRYCICKFFGVKDFLDAYEDYKNGEEYINISL